MSSNEGKRELKNCAEQLTCCTGKKETERSTTLMKDFDVLKTLAQGRFSQILLVKKTLGVPKSPNEQRMVLKAFHFDDAQSLDSFQRELSTNYTLSPHPNIVTSFNVSFTWESSFVFAQEFAPCGDLRKYMKKTKGLSAGIKEENYLKLIMKQVASALEFMHLSFQIVHGNVRPENVLVFNPDFSQIKVCDFGSSFTEGDHVPRNDGEDPAYLPPETSEALPGERYYVSMSSDAWQLGILLVYAVTGRVPWGSPDFTDPNYSKYSDWLRRKSLRMPDNLKTFSPRLLRLLKRLLEPKPRKRYEVKEVFKYMKDEWLVRPRRMSLLRRQSETVTIMEEESKRVSVGRARSVSSSPAVGFRRGSSSSSILVNSSSEGIPERQSSLKSSNQNKSVKTVKFDDSADEKLFQRSRSWK